MIRSHRSTFFPGWERSEISSGSLRRIQITNVEVEIRNTRKNVHPSHQSSLPAGRNRIATKTRMVTTPRIIIPLLLVLFSGSLSPACGITLSIPANHPGFSGRWIAKLHTSSPWRTDLTSSTSTDSCKISSQSDI